MISSGFPPAPGRGGPFAGTAAPSGKNAVAQADAPRAGCSDPKKEASMSRWLLAVASLAFLAPLARAEAPAPGAPDAAAVARYVAEARAVSDADAGRLWGRALYGPLLFVDPATRRVVANQADAQGRLAPTAGGLFAGRLTDDAGAANTATTWSGVRWTMLVLPMPDGADDRRETLAHEMWHRVQDGLGFPPTDALPRHLDEPQGRLWLRLEWRALSAALRASGAERRRAVADALLFRARRRALYGAEAAETERALEMNEGLAQYTGVRLGQTDPRAAAARAAAMIEGVPSYVRSFAYASGPLYGLLLDDAAPAWRKGLTAKDDLGARLGAALGLVPAADVAQEADARALVYGGPALRQEEERRAERLAARLAAYRARLVDGPALIIPNEDANFEFDPRDVTPLGDAGDAYPHLRVAGAWGVLDARDGARIAAGFSAFVVPAPKDPAARPLAGDGWTLALNSGWTLAPAKRAGDFVVRRAK